MQSAKTGMGSTKHGKSGYCTRSPRYKHLKQIEANKTEVKAKPVTTDWKDDFKDLFK